MSQGHYRVTGGVLLLGVSWLMGGLFPLGQQQDSSQHYDLSSFEDTGNGRLYEALRTIGSRTPSVLFADVDDTLRSDVNIPVNISLVQHGASRIDLAGHDLKISGPFSAARAQVFRGGGTVSFAPGSTDQVIPQWWGENTSASVQEAMDAAATSGAELFLGAGEYRFDTTVKWIFEDTNFDARALNVRGAGPGRTVINNHTPGQPSFFFGTESPIAQQGWFLTVEGLELTSPGGTGSSGIMIEDVWNGRISDCLVSDHALDGILLSADVNDFGLPKTWTIERSLIVRNGRYGINLAAPGDATVAFNVTLDQLDIELNEMGGIFAAAELSRITNSIIANNGTGPTSHGGIYMTGITGYRVYENVIADSGFEANLPYDIYADRVANLTIARNDLSRIQNVGGASQDNFIRLNGPLGAFHVLLEQNQFSSGIVSPFTAILGGAGLESIELDNNRFNLQPGNKPTSFLQATKTTHRTLGDTVLTNQVISFSGDQTGIGDLHLERGGPGILSVEGIAMKLQSIASIGGALTIDCSQGLTVLHSLTENTIVQVPLNPVPGAVIRLSVFQPPATAYSIGFDPIFKVAEPFTASGLRFSTIQFFYTGLYWVQLGGAAIDAPL
ncbi:MAG: hypothetical protein ACJAZN_000388 [Planctomycetota bacterium]|jgi:hypothetical protein